MEGMGKSDSTNATPKRKEPSRQEKVAKLEQEEMRSEQMRMVRAGEKLAKLEQKEMRREQMRMVRAVRDAKKDMRMVRVGRDAKEDPFSVLRKYILPLNNALPEEFGIYWVVAEEIHQRLIHAGVRSSLILEMVEDALRNNNRGEKMLRGRLASTRC